MGCFNSKDIESDASKLDSTDCKWQTSSACVDLAEFHEVRTAEKPTIVFETPIQKHVRKLQFKNPMIDRASARSSTGRTSSCRSSTRGDEMAAGLMVAESHSYDFSKQAYKPKTGKTELCKRKPERHRATTRTERILAIERQREIAKNNQFEAEYGRQVRRNHWRAVRKPIAADLAKPAKSEQPATFMSATKLQGLERMERKR
eukprot:SAG11_NODE_2208_length_3685_cov_1.936419_3_plen_203_part_00